MEFLRLASFLILLISQSSGMLMEQNKPLLLISQMKHVGDHCEYNGAPCNFFHEPGKECRNSRCSCLTNYLEISFNGFPDCILKPNETCIENHFYAKGLLDRNSFIKQISNYSQIERMKELAVYDSFESHIKAFNAYSKEKTGKDLSCSSGKCDSSINRCTKGVNSAFTLNEDWKEEEEEGEDAFEKEFLEDSSNVSLAILWIFVTIGIILAVGSLIYYYRFSLFKRFTGPRFTGFSENIL